MEDHIPSNFTIISNDEEDSQKLLDAETGEIILEGDFCHNGIYARIAGFLQCMDYFGYAYTCNRDE